MNEELKPLELNKSLVMNEDYKKIITSAENGRYRYHDYSKEIIQEIANKNTEGLYCNDINPIVQALFPQYLICSGLWDNFLMFEIKDNERANSPKYSYLDVGSYLDNDKEAKCNLLMEEILDLFYENKLSIHPCWIKALATVKEELEGK